MKRFILLILLALVPVVSEELENNKKPVEPKTHNVEVRFRRQSFTYIPSELTNDYNIYYYSRSELKNNKVNTYIPDFQYFNNKYKFRAELSTFSFDKSNMYFNYFPPGNQSVLSNRIFFPIRRTDSKFNLMKTITWGKLDLFLGIGYRDIKKERGSEYTFSYLKMNSHTIGGQLVLKLQFRISEYFFLRTGIEYFRTKGDLDYAYFTTSGAKGELYPLDIKPSVIFEGTDFEISGFVKLYENLFLNVGYSEIKARNSLKRFIPGYRRSLNDPLYLDTDLFLSSRYPSVEFLRGWNIGLMAQF